MKQYSKPFFKSVNVISVFERKLLAPFEIYVQMFAFLKKNKQKNKTSTTAKLNINLNLKILLHLWAN